MSHFTTLIGMADRQAQRFLNGGLTARSLELWLVTHGFYQIVINETRVAASYDGIAYMLGVFSNERL